jgi:hypothetical protein
VASFGIELRLEMAAEPAILGGDLKQPGYLAETTLWVAPGPWDPRIHSIAEITQAELQLAELAVR